MSVFTKYVPARTERSSVGVALGSGVALGKGVALGSGVCEGVNVGAGVLVGPAVFVGPAVAVGASVASAVGEASGVGSLVGADSATLDVATRCACTVGSASSVSTNCATMPQRTQRTSAPTTMMIRLRLLRSFLLPVVSSTCACWSSGMLGPFHRALNDRCKQSYRKRVACQVLLARRFVP